MFRNVSATECFLCSFLSPNVFSVNAISLIILIRNKPLLRTISFLIPSSNVLIHRTCLWFSWQHWMSMQPIYWVSMKFLCASPGRSLFDSPFAEGFVRDRDQHWYITLFNTTPLCLVLFRNFCDWMLPVPFRLKNVIFPNIFSVNPISLIVLIQKLNLKTTSFLIPTSNV